MQTNDWKGFNRFVKYGKPISRPKSTHWIIKYGDTVLTHPLPYSACQIALKTFKMQGILYPDKQKFKITGA